MATSECRNAIALRLIINLKLAEKQRQQFLLTDVTNWVDFLEISQAVGMRRYER